GGGRARRRTARRRKTQARRGRVSAGAGRSARARGARDGRDRPRRRSKDVGGLSPEPRRQGPLVGRRAGPTRRAAEGRRVSCNDAAREDGGGRMNARPVMSIAAVLAACADIASPALAGPSVWATARDPDLERRSQALAQADAKLWKAGRAHHEAGLDPTATLR